MDYELVIMRNCDKIVQFWGDTIIQDGKVYSQVTLKSLYTVIIIIRCVYKMFLLTNHKMVVTNIDQYIAQVFWLTRRSTQQWQRKEPALQPQLVSKPSTGSNKTRLISYRARNK